MSNTSRLSSNRVRSLNRNQENHGTFSPKTTNVEHNVCDLEAGKIAKDLTDLTQRIPGVSGGVSKIESVKAWITDSVRNLHLIARRNPNYLNQAKQQALNKIDHQLNQIQDHTEKCGDDLGLDIGKYKNWLNDNKKEIEDMKPPQSSSIKLKSKTLGSSNPVPGWVSDRLKDAGNVYNAINEAAYNTGLSRFMGAPDKTGYEPKKPQFMPGIEIKPDYSKYGIQAPATGAAQLAPIRIPIP